MTRRSTAAPLPTPTAPWYDTAMHDTELEALARRAFPDATQIIILAASDPGWTLFQDADAALEAAGIAATSWNPTTRVLYLRRLPPARGPGPTPHPRPAPPD